MKIVNASGDLVLVGERYLFPGQSREVEVAPNDPRVHVVGQPSAVGVTDAAAVAEPESQNAPTATQRGRGRRKVFSGDK